MCYKTKIYSTPYAGTAGAREPVEGPLLKKRGVTAGGGFNINQKWLWRTCEGDGYFIGLMGEVGGGGCGGLAQGGRYIGGEIFAEGMGFEVKIAGGSGFRYGYGEDGVEAKTY